MESLCAACFDAGASIARPARRIDWRVHTVIRLSRAAMWACAIVLAAVFVLVGMSKLEGPSALRWAERFAQWGYPAAIRPVVGVFEILSGLGVLIPRLRRSAAAGLLALMMGALCTHAMQAEFPRLIPPLVLGGLAFLLYSSPPRPSDGQTADRTSMS